MLPGINGLDICKRVRFENINTPIIILTAKETEIDKVLGLELGADDYVSKPFSMLELLARIKSNVRRSKKLFEHTRSLSKKHINHLGITIDTDKRQVLYDDNEILFRPKEFELLHKLMSNPGKVFTREQLVQDIWGFEYFGDTRTVDVHIRWIREKIEENSQKPTKIITLRGVGYKSNVE